MSRDIIVQLFQKLSETASVFATHSNPHQIFLLGNVTQVQDLIEEGADVNLVDGNGRTPLYIATFFSK